MCVDRPDPTATAALIAGFAGSGNRYRFDANAPKPLSPQLKSGCVCPIDTRLGECNSWPVGRGGTPRQDLESV